MRKNTNYLMKCPVCGSPMYVTENILGRYQAFCVGCHTSIFLNQPAAIELALLKKIIYEKPVKGDLCPT